jgi:hypothetical protein
LVTQPLPAEFNVEDYVDEVEKNIRYSHQLARECLRKATNRRKKYYDLKVNSTTYQKNDWVWYYYPRRYSGKSPKWQRHYTGPFLVIEKLGPVNYIIQKSLKADPIIVHVDKLKAYEGETPSNWSLSPHLNPDVLIRNEDFEPEVVVTPTEIATSDQVHRDEMNGDDTTRRKRQTRPPTWMDNYMA